MLYWTDCKLIKREWGKGGEDSSVKQRILLWENSAALGGKTTESFQYYSARFFQTLDQQIQNYLCRLLDTYL